MSMKREAERALAHFQKGDREAQHHGGEVTVISPSAPDWLRELCYGKSGETTSDFRVEAVEAALLSVYDEDDTFEPEFTEAHSRASYHALANDADLRRGVDRIISPSSEFTHEGPLTAIISYVANDVMIGIYDRVVEGLENDIEESPEP